MRRRLIGRLVAAWEDGRRDERAGRPSRLRREPTTDEQAAYRGGMMHERRAMREQDRLAQFELQLELALEPARAAIVPEAPRRARRSRSAAADQLPLL